MEERFLSEGGFTECPWDHINRIGDFTSDGCSLFPDGNLRDRTLWCECCFRHDIAYWQGEKKEDRLNADKLNGYFARHPRGYCIAR